VEVDLEAGGGIDIGDILPMVAVEDDAFGCEAVEVEEAAVAEVAQDAVGGEDGDGVDEEVDVSGGAEAEVAERGLGEGKAFEDADGDVVRLEFVNDAAEFGEGAERLVGVGGGEFAELGEDGLAGGVWRCGAVLVCRQLGEGGVEIVGDDGDEAVVLREEEETRPFEQAGGEFADEAGVFWTLGPAGAEEEEVEFGGAGGGMGSVLHACWPLWSQRIHEGWGKAPVGGN
jgi:hypothetical protein